MKEEIMEPEVLSYREFRNRETLLAWERRRRAVDSQGVKRSETGSRGDHFMKLLRGSQAGSPPPR